MRILIAGAGAIGTFVGARLALAGHQVTLVGRERLVEAVRDRGITLIEPAGSRQIATMSAATHIGAAIEDYGPFDLGLITVKAYDTATVIAELAAGGERGLPLLLTLQNGVGNEEALAEAFGAERIITGAIDTPVSVPAPGQVQVHRPAYRIGLAPVGAASPAGTVADSLAGAGFTVNLYADYRGLKWTKLLMNILANAACAILDWTPAQVMGDPETAALEARAWQEALAVMARQKIGAVALGGYPFPLFVPLARRLPPAWLARVLRGFVSGGRGSKMPSLQIALSSAKPSEVDWLNGAVARAGSQLGVPTPVNTLYDGLLAALSRREVPWDDYRGHPEKLVALAADPQALIARRAPGER